MQDILIAILVILLYYLLILFLIVFQFLPYLLFGVPYYFVCSALGIEFISCDPGFYHWIWPVLLVTTAIGIAVSSDRGWLDIRR